MQTSDVVSRVQEALALIGEGYSPKAWHVASWRDAAECMKEKPQGPRHR